VQGYDLWESTTNRTSVDYLSRVIKILATGHNKPIATQFASGARKLSANTKIQE
jgi:hypothetical protein